jgi:hypothetical protein
MEKTDAHLVANRRVVNARRIIENEIEGFIFTRAAYRPRPDQVFAVSYVDWQPNSMRFVTAYSLQDAWRGRPQVAQFSVIPGEKNIGVRLIVNETPFTNENQTGAEITGLEVSPQTGMQITRFAPVVPGPASFVLADKLAYCRFSYLQPLPAAPFQIWRPDWDQLSLPLGIRIEMAPLEQAPAEIHVTTVTASLPVNLNPAVRYIDAQ